MSSQQTADSGDSEDNSQEEEVKSRLSDEPEMCEQDYEFFEWEDVCECPRSVTMHGCSCLAYKAHREASAASAADAAGADRE
jgi:hypothetical protein